VTDKLSTDTSANKKFKLSSSISMEDSGDSEGNTRKSDAENQSMNALKDESCDMDDNLTACFSSFKLSDESSSSSSATLAADHHLLSPMQDKDKDKNRDLVSESDIRAAMFAKRGTEHLTVEGSPFRVQYKRLDISSTPLYPLTKPETQAVDDPSTTDAVVSAINRLDVAGAAAGAGADNTTISKDKKLLVIVSSGKHETGSHQENHMRLALLVDKDEGCLGREPVSPHIDILHDTANLRKANLVDLLR
jgi:hypothetical protein